MAAGYGPWSAPAWTLSDSAGNKAWARQASRSYSDQVLLAGHINGLRYHQRTVRGHDTAAEPHKARKDNLRIRTHSSRTGSSHTHSSSPTEEAMLSAAICSAQTPLYLIL